ncbi:MAG: gliding motility-associated C-terminal domain-containing protein, partial [Flavobacteriales bacterium]|nr:gliding motility-associated C-terminal domain-containing protein [Flavobacteriales bacterium]
DEVDIIYHLEPKDILPEIVYFCTARLPEFDLSHLDGTLEWSDGSTSSFYIAQFNGAHWVDFTDSYHCFTVRDSVIAHEEVCGCPIYMPNAFTPDGDGLNDVFKCEYECAPYDFTMEIYDRWGNVSFRTHSPYDGWDGKFQGDIAPTGVYHYRIWYRESFSGIPIEHFGNVTVLPGKL